jgi:hypothetical protein
MPRKLRPAGHLLHLLATQHVVIAATAGSIVLKRAADEELLQIVRLVKPLQSDQPTS